jgi:nicotinate-nucleotide adenylyltransferase
VEIRGVNRRHIGVLGGTFDPVHFGHLRTALELQELLHFERMLLIPSGVPPHRPAPVAAATQRLQMVQLALQGDTRLQADGRECRKAGTTYTVDSLRELRAEFGAGASLNFCVGADAFAGMLSWHCWQQLPELCNIVVMPRPGWHLPEDLGALEIWRQRFIYQSDTLSRSAAGKVLFVSLTPMAVSATHIRELIAAEKSARYLLPDTVWQYIRQHRLYQADKPGTTNNTR